MHFINKNYFVPIRGEKTRFRPIYCTLTLGESYWIRTNPNRKLCLVKFIKVTGKGFNFLDESTSRCILKNHLYVKGMAGKTIPKRDTTFRVGLPPWISEIKDFQKCKMA